MHRGEVRWKDARAFARVHLSNSFREQAAAALQGAGCVRGAAASIFTEENGADLAFWDWFYAACVWQTGIFF
jgi:hypothetical protein